MQILQSAVALCQQVSNVLGKPQKQKLRQDFDLTARKEPFKIPIDRCIALLPVVHFSIRLQWLA